LPVEGEPTNPLVRKTAPDRSAERAAQWAAVPPRLATTLTGYIAQTRLSLRASTMVRVEGVLREFAGWLAVNAPEVLCVADLRRACVTESFEYVQNPVTGNAGVDIDGTVKQPAPAPKPGYVRSTYTTPAGCRFPGLAGRRRIQRRASAPTGRKPAGVLP
jgi:hypothetical protein